MQKKEGMLKKIQNDNTKETRKQLNLDKLPVCVYYIFLTVK